MLLQNAAKVGTWDALHLIWAAASTSRLGALHAPLSNIHPSPRARGPEDLALPRLRGGSLALKRESRDALFEYLASASTQPREKTVV